MLNKALTKARWFMKTRYHSLYFASIGPKQACIALYALATAFYARDTRRRQLHKLVRSYFGTGQILAYSSGRASITAFLTAAGVGPKSSVLLSSFTCLAVPTAVLAVGSKPIYADINTSSLNVDFSAIKNAIQDDTKVIVVQHTMGRPVDDINEICEFANKKNILVIEDCALSLGTLNKGLPLGQSGDAAIFSLELSKTLSAGWGGILLNNNKKLESALDEEYKNTTEEHGLTVLRKLLQIITTGFLYQKNVYFFGKYIVSLGYKLKLFKGSTPEHESHGKVSHNFVSRLSGGQAKLAISQFKRINEVASINNRNLLYLQKCLKDSGLKVLGAASKEDFPVSPRVAFLVNDPHAASVWFYRRGIELGRWFDGPLSPLPIFNFDKGQFPNVRIIANHIVNLPCHNRLTESDLVWINNNIQMFVKENPSQCDFRFNE
jgi:perosamine synthetase